MEKSKRSYCKSLDISQVLKLYFAIYATFVIEIDNDDLQVEELFQNLNLSKLIFKGVKHELNYMNISIEDLKAIISLLKKPEFEKKKVVIIQFLKEIDKLLQDYGMHHDLFLSNLITNFLVDLLNFLYDNFEKTSPALKKFDPEYIEKYFMTDKLKRIQPYPEIFEVINIIPRYDPVKKKLILVNDISEEGIFIAGNGVKFKNGLI